jgi:hypothetical protein
MMDLDFFSFAIALVVTFALSRIALLAAGPVGEEGTELLVAHGISLVLCMVLVAAFGGEERNRAAGLAFIVCAPAQLVWWLFDAHRLSRHQR